MFPDKILVVDPKVLVRQELPPLDFKFKVNLLEGDFYLVKPRTAREVTFLQLLGKNIGCWLPADGEGLLIKRTALKGL